MRWASAAVESGEVVLDTWSPPGSGIHTHWEPPALRWRLDDRSGVLSTASRLREADVPHGAVHRTVGGVARTLVVSSTWGDERTVARLLRALAWQHKVLAVLAPGGAGARRARPRAGFARGQSLLCVWDQRAGQHGDVMSTERWALDGLDLEGVI